MRLLRQTSYTRIPGVLTPMLFRLIILASLTVVSARAQITNVTNDQSTPIPGAGHDYIHLLSETVNPSNGSVSIRIQPPMPEEIKLHRVKPIPTAAHEQTKQSPSATDNPPSRTVPQTIDLTPSRTTENRSATPGRVISMSAYHTLKTGYGFNVDSDDQWRPIVRYGHY
jgi:hypothetical protein